MNEESKHSAQSEPGFKVEIMSRKPQQTAVKPYVLTGSPDSKQSNTKIPANSSSVKKRAKKLEKSTSLRLSKRSSADVFE